MEAQRQNSARQRLRAVTDRIHRACQSCRRDPSQIRLLAVSKTQPVEKIRALIQLGHLAFGESYISEAESKITALAGTGAEWHFIAPVQSNKTRVVARDFDWVQSVDRLKILQRLDAQRPQEAPPLNVCIQINIDNEPQKAGCDPAALEDLARAAAGADRLRLRGIMAIPAVREDAADQEAVFRKLAGLYQTLQRQYPTIDTFSAGMSADLESAIRAGSTMVRVGTALFGPRRRNDN